jgi:hypothetical protein
MCINNNDPRLSGCGPLDIASFRVVRPSASSSDPSDRTLVATLEGAAGPGGFGVSIVEGKSQTVPGILNSAPDLCSGLLPIVVPLKLRASGAAITGRKTVIVQTISSDGIVDTDMLMLTCRPAP